MRRFLVVLMVVVALNLPGVRQQAGTVVQRKPVPVVAALPDSTRDAMQRLQDQVNKNPQPVQVDWHGFQLFWWLWR